MNACIAISILLAAGAPGPDSPIQGEIVEVKRIADDAPHSAFTDLILFRDQFVCAFRQGRGHVSVDGRIRVLVSTDGREWEKAATLTMAGFDLRDASLSVTPDNRLMLLGGASPRKTDNETAPTGTFVAFSDDGRQWTAPRIVVEPGRWLWRVTWHDATAYGVSYAARENFPVASLLTSEDGTTFTTLAPRLLDEGYPTEAVIRFDDEGTAICLQRRDGAPDANSAMLGLATAPYDTWQWHDLGIYFGGPNLIQLPNGRWLAAGRVIRDGTATTELAELDVDAKTLTPLLTLPSGGDTSYPGLVIKDDFVWVSYYSSHEGKTSIYLAKVRIPN